LSNVSAVGAGSLHTVVFPLGIWHVRQNLAEDLQEIQDFSHELISFM
jgi:hypothetical protein